MKSSEKKKTDPYFTVILYDDTSSKTLSLEEISNYLKKKLGDIEIQVRKDFINYHLNLKIIDKYAAEIAKCKVRNLINPNFDIDPLFGEIRYERQLIEHPKKRLSGVLYDGYRLNRVLQSLIPPEELDFNILHIIFTNRLFGTFDEADGRYHARVIICGYPSLISTTGIVEAPAKPIEYYHFKQKHLALGTGIPLEVIKNKFLGRFIDYDDPRLTDVMKGYVMQSVFYYLIHEPFCEDENCRLYNAHWQEKVINAQLKGGEFCVKHEKILNDIKDKRK